MNAIVNRKKHEIGVGLVEYALILLFLALGVLAAMVFIGPSIEKAFSQVSATLSGATGGAALSAAPITWKTCANENGFCAFSGTAKVQYGANSTWTAKTFTGGVACTNAVFGDPLVGTVKSCQIQQ